MFGKSIMIASRGVARASAKVHVQQRLVTVAVAGAGRRSSSSNHHHDAPVVARGFSGASEGPSLHEVLANEIASEAADDEVDQEYLDAKKAVESTFKIHEKDGEGVVTLESKYKGETVEVTFDCQDEEELEMSEEAMEGITTNGEQDGDDAMGELDVGINFDVVIGKKEGKLVVSCTAAQHLKINQVRYVAAGKNLEDQELYGGPVFDQLDDELQDAFYAYLADRGINEDLCFFILAHSGVKEQHEYVTWLHKILDFTAK